MSIFKNNRRVFIQLMIVVVLWGLNAIAIKYLTAFYPPLALAPIRMCIAAVVLVPVVLRSNGYCKLPGPAWPPTIGIAAFSIFFHQIALNVGVTYTSGTHSVLILGLNPLFTTVFAGWLMKEQITWSKAVGVILGLGGLIMVVSGNLQDNASIFGDGIMLVATIAFVIGSLFVKKATRFASPLVVAAYSHCIAAIGLVVLGIFANPVWHYTGNLGVVPIAVILFSSVLSTALGAVWWNAGIQKIGASSASLFPNLSPIIGVFASAFFLGEQVGWQHIVSLLLVVAGVCLGTGVVPIPEWRTNKSVEHQ